MVEWNYQQENEHGTRYREKVALGYAWLLKGRMLLALIRDRCLNSNYRKLR